jgi:hypothetical protein
MVLREPGGASAGCVRSFCFAGNAADLSSFCDWIGRKHTCDMEGDSAMPETSDEMLGDPSLQCEPLF